MRPDEVGVTEREHHGAYDLGEPHGSIGAGGRGGRGQPQPGDRGRRLERFDPCAAVEVMDLVDDEQPEAIAERIHVAIGALEREDRDPLDGSMPVAEETDSLVRPLAPELVEPSAGQDPRRT